MPTEDTLQVEISLDPGTFAEEQLEAATQSLLRQLHGLDAVDKVERAIEAAPTGSKSGTGRAVPGKLTVLTKKAKELVQFLAGYLPHHRVKLTIKGKDKSLELDLPGNRSQKDILELIEKARAFSK